MQSLCNPRSLTPGQQALWMRIAPPGTGVYRVRRSRPVRDDITLTVGTAILQSLTVARFAGAFSCPGEEARAFSFRKEERSVRLSDKVT